MNKIIAVFNQDLTPAAFLSVDQSGAIKIEATSIQLEVFADLIEYLKHNNPRIRKEIDGIVFLAPVKKDSSQYLDAIVLELELRGFWAKSIYEDFKDLLIDICKKGTGESRAEALQLIVNADQFEVQEIRSAMGEMLALAQELRVLD
jgi:hypothetical protein